MGWVQGIARQLAKEAPESAAMMSVKADLGQAAVGGGIGAVLPADTAEERLRNIGVGAAVGVGAGRLERVLPGMDAAAANSASGFAGARSSTANLRKLERAKAMDKAGIDPRETWEKTGWFKDFDGQFKYEIDDSKSRLKLDEAQVAAGGRFSLGDVLYHPKLAAAYSDLNRWTVSFVDMGPVKRGADGQLNGSLGATFNEFRRIEINKNLSPEDARSTLIHEIDHGIQFKEGFGQGTSPMSAKPIEDVPIVADIRAYIADAEKTLKQGGLSAEQKAKLGDDIAKAKRDLDLAARFAGYLHSHGEVMARNTETRLNMSEGARRELFPQDSIDVDPAKITVKRSPGTSKTPGFHPWMADGGDFGHLKRYETPLELTEADRVLQLDELALTDKSKVAELDQVIAYHGTNKTFDRFTTQAMGTGEGAQAFGPGLYFTQSSRIADWYRKRMANLSPGIKVGGEPFMKSNPKHFAMSVYWYNRNPRKFDQVFDYYYGEKFGMNHWSARDRALRTLKFDRKHLESTAPFARNRYGSYAKNRIASKDKKEIADYLDAAIKYLEDLDPESSKGVPKLSRKNPGAGSIYTAKLDLPPPKTILYDKALADQPDAVRAAFDKAFAEGVLPEYVTDAYTKSGDQMHMDPFLASLSRAPGVMDIVRKEGIRGVKYLDGISRGGKREKPSFNYVVFDDDHISIVSRDNKHKVPMPRGAWPAAVIAGVGAAALLGGGEADAQELPEDQLPPDPLAQFQDPGSASEQVASDVENPPEDEVPSPSLPAGFQPARQNPTFTAFQATTVPGMEAAPESVRGEETTGAIRKPEGLEVWGAAFRLENVIGSALAKDQPEYGEWEEGFNPLAPENLEGYEEHADRFIDARTSTRMEQIKQQIDRETADRQTIARSGWNGIAASLAAGTIDPTILIPVGGQVKKGETLLKIGGRFALAGGAGATVSEIALQSTQELRTKEETALNIAGGTVLGGILGSGGYAITRKLTGKGVWAFDPEIKTLGDRFEREMVYDPANDPVFEPARLDQAMIDQAPAQPQSVGAARAAEATLEDYALAPSMGTADVTAAMKLNPLLRLATANSAKAREAAALLMENGMYLNRNKQGLASPVSVEQAMTEYRGWHASAEKAAVAALKEHRKAGGQLSGRQFHEEVGRALRRGDQHEDPYVVKAAQAYRSAIEKTKERAIEAGLLPEDVETTTAASYFHRMWNRNVLIRKPEQFRTMVTAWLGETFENIRTRAAQLEAEQAQRGDYVSKLSDDFREQSLAATKAERDATKAAKQVADEIAKLREKEDKAIARREDLSDQALDLADQIAELGPDTPAAAKIRKQVDALSAKIKELDERAAAHERKIEDAQARADREAELARGKRNQSERLKSERDTAKEVYKLSDEDMKFIQSARELAEIERIEGSLDGYSEEAAGHIYETLMGYDSRTLPAGITAAARGPLKERTFNIPDLYEYEGIRAEDFLVSDAQEVMDRYMRVMAADIELARAFGKPDMTDVFDGIKAEYKKLIDAAKTEAEKKRLGNEMDARISDLEGVRDVIRGNFGQPTYENMFARGAGVIRHWNYATMLGGMTISALPDVGNKVMANGFLGIARDLVAPLIADLGKVKVAAREAEALGIAVERTLATRIASMADIGDVYGRATVFERVVGAMSNHFTKWTGMRLWNDVMKQADYIIASNRAIRSMSRPDRIGKPAKTWLANLGIGEADYARIMAQVRKYGTESGSMKLANVDQWDDPVARRTWIGAMGKNANIQTVTPGAGDKLLMMNTELGKTIGQFKTFAFAANQRVTVRGAQQMRMGHARVASALATYITMGMLVYYLKQVGSGRTPSEDPVTWVREGVDRSGIVSVAMEAFNTAEKLTGQTFVGSSPASRYATRGPFASLLGPSVGKGEDAANLLRNAFDGKLQDRDIHALRKMLPYNNIFWLRKILDEFEIAAVDATGAEETSLSERRESVLN